MTISILAWGSLVYDPRDLCIEGEWQSDGPNLSIEYARISGPVGERRLTLVIKPGFSASPVLYVKSCFESLPEARENLRLREGTPEIRNIGFIDFISGNQSIKRLKREIFAELTTWNTSKGIDAIIWTDLAPNFSDKTGMRFNVQNIFGFLRGLSQGELHATKDYVQKTPAQIQTQFRRDIDGFFLD